MKIQEGEAVWRVRNYLLWEGSNKFFCRGHITSGPKPWYPIIVFSLIQIFSLLYFGFPIVHFLMIGHVYFAIIAIPLWLTVSVSLLWTSFIDPGYVLKQSKSFPWFLERQSTLMKGGMVPLKFCATCNIIWAPRTIHCSYCDCCVERMDHHCPWLGCCIGKRNYTLFFIFITSLAFYCVFAVLSTLAHLVALMVEYNSSHNFGWSIWYTFRWSPVAIPLIAIASFTSIFVLLLVTYHCKLARKGLTTHEDMKMPQGKLYNPYLDSTWKSIFR